MKAYFHAILWRLFPFFERLGVHVLPVHYYSPIPDTHGLKKQTARWKQPHPMTGIDMRTEQQLEYMSRTVAPMASEYERVGQGVFGFDQRLMSSYAPINALTLYATIRQSQPKHVIEVGSGLSTAITAAAMNENARHGHPGSFTAIEPYPTARLRQGFPGLTSLKMEKVEDVALAEFERLESGDVLFIDSSHTVKIFGDVNYLFLSVLPRLKPGVIVHIHDIFFPFDYLPHHFFSPGLKQIWQEQYLLHAFLIGNKDWEVVVSSSWLHHYRQDELRKTFSWYHADRWPSSFWMKRKSV